MAPRSGGTPAIGTLLPSSGWSGGIAAALAWLNLGQRSTTSPLELYGILGYVVIAAMLTTIVLMHGIHTLVAAKRAAASAADGDGPVPGR